MTRKKKTFVCEECDNEYKGINRNPGNDGILRCKSCRLKQQNIKTEKRLGTTAWFAYADNPKYQSKQLQNSLLRKYNITIDDYTELLDQQGNVCAICREDEPNGRLCVDHNHKTGQVRGLLCHKCNRAIGSLNDDIKTIRGASIYLLRHDTERSWDRYFMHLAEVVATRSKDPSTQVGAVIVRDKVILSTGYNGFPRGVNDNISSRYDRPEKYVWMCHAEENAIMNAAREGVKIDKATIYVTPLSPCIKCSRAIIQAGITEVVFEQLGYNSRFNEEMIQARDMLTRSKVNIRSPE